MRLPVVVAAVLLLAGCSSGPPTPKQESARRETTAPEQYRVRFDTTKGPFTIEVVRAWAPRGADRFYELVQNKFFDEARFFRVVKGFVVQFGINRDPQVSERWRKMQIVDDRVKQPNARGTIAYATSGPNTRTTQVFINLKDNSKSLDARGFAPFGRVVEGMDVVDGLYGGYGDSPPMGYYGPDQNKIEAEGNAYLERSFPRLDHIRTATIVTDKP